MADEKKQPTRKYRSGGITLTVWKNEGKDGEYETFSLDRNYKDKDDKWQKTNSYRLQDLLRVSQVMQKAFEDSTLKVE